VLHEARLDDAMKTMLVSDWVSRLSTFA